MKNVPQLPDPTKLDSLPKWAKEYVTLLQYTIERRMKELARLQQTADKDNESLARAIDVIIYAATEGNEYCKNYLDSIYGG